MINNLFNSARLKLTFWYLTIIMAISIAFSIIIYFNLTREISWGIRRGKLRQQAEQIGLHLPPDIPQDIEEEFPRLKNLPECPECVNDLKEARKRVVLSLATINGAVFFIAGLSGYWLAGQTLQPIEKAMEDQKRFVADASHELRTPLTALKTSIEVALRNKKLTLRKAKKILNNNLESVDEMQALAENLLILAKYQHNGQKLKFEEVDLKKIVNRALKKVKPMADEKNISVKTSSKEIQVEGNEQDLEKMIVAFLDNAVKYTEENGKIEIKIKRNRKDAIIEISDTGIGIPEEDVSHIFDRFYQVNGSRCKTEICGFGLGLSVAKKIIDFHHGTVLVESKLGKGTTFVIKLPLKRS
jgi:two-component system sensor histidine kinase CiaH